MELDELLTKHSDNYRFHGARGWLSELIAQAENGEIRLWGRSTDDAVDGEVECEWVQGEGYLYCTDIREYGLCYSDFCEGNEVVLVLEKIVAEPQEWFPRASRQERLIRVEEYKVIGGIRPLFDEDGDEIDVEAFSLEEILNEEF